MTNPNTNSLTTVLSDADAESRGSLKVRVVANHSAISVFPEGYGDCGSAEGHGSPFFLELYQDRLRLVVFADINQEDPTHIIDLDGAREDRREQPVGPIII